MSAVATDHAPLALPPAAPATRRNVALVGTTFAIAAGIALVGGLLAAYFGARQDVVDAGGEWVDKATIPNVGMAVAYGTLLLSAFTAQWAVSAIKLDDRRQAYVAVGLTLLLGAAFLNALSFGWSQLGAAAGDGGFADHMYAVTVAHALLVVAGIVLLVVMGFRVIGGQFGPRNSEFVASAAAFWHFTAIAGAAIWWSIWFLEGGPG
jgi:heme/copper-type cytochrome/quinol oxidase subunit 3